MDDDIKFTINFLAKNAQSFADSRRVVYHTLGSIENAREELRMFSAYMLGRWTPYSIILPQSPITQEDDIAKITRLLHDGYRAIELRDAQALNGFYVFENAQYSRNNSALRFGNDNNTLTITTQFNADDLASVQVSEIRSPVPNSVIFYLYFWLLDPNFSFPGATEEFLRLQALVQSKCMNALRQHKMLNLLYVVAEMMTLYCDMKNPELDLTNILAQFATVGERYENRIIDDPGATYTSVGTYRNDEVFTFLQNIANTLWDDINQRKEELSHHPQGGAAMATDDDPGGSSMFCLRLTLSDNCKHTEQKV